MCIKTRFAPSPTGNLHIGSLRTALYSWLYAKKKKGIFILRIEDSDKNRSNKKYSDNIIRDLKWLKINWINSPIFQSQRINYYKKIIKKMLKTNLAYKCFCTKNRLKNLRKKQKISQKKFRYDRKCRTLSKDLYKKKNFKNKKYVVRFKNPIFGKVIFKDEIRGKIIFKNSELDDLVIQRSDGTPTYNFCVVVDDIDSKVTHVIRGEDHINNTPRQINIIKALGEKVPRYIHLSMILDSSKRKLSKRYCRNSIFDYKNRGYLPEAILNYVVRLGWSFKNEEIFSLKKLKNLFSLKRIHLSSSIFDEKKLLWYNKYYINNLPISKIKKYLKKFFLLKNLKILKKPDLNNFIKIFSSQVYTLEDFYQYYLLFFKKKIKLEKFSEFLNIKTYKIINYVFNNLKKIKFWKIPLISLILKNTIKHFNCNFSKLGRPIRFILTGTFSSPGIDKILFLYGKKQSLEKIKKFLKKVVLFLKK